MLRIDPPPRVFIDFTASWRHRNGARRLTAIIRSQNSTGASSRRARETSPGVVDQDVNAAAPFNRVANEAPAGVGVAEVGLHADRVVTGTP